MEVVDGGNIARDYFDLVQRLTMVQLHGSLLRIGLPLGGVRFLCAQPAGCGHQPGGQDQNQDFVLTTVFTHFVHPLVVTSAGFVIQSPAAASAPPVMTALMPVQMDAMPGE